MNLQNLQDCGVNLAMPSPFHHIHMVQLHFNFIRKHYVFVCAKLMAY